MIEDDDRRLLGHVRPPGWRNPSPKPLYDLVVIGGGTAGLVCAAGAAGLGARVALVERHRLGGDCLNTGCVPSKALLRSAHVVGELRAGRALGVAAAPHVDFDAVMARLRARRADIAPNDSAARLAGLGVDVFFGDAAFSGPTTARVESHYLRVRKAVVATGTRPAIPPVPGLADVAYLTNETVFDVVEQPVSLAVLGGGPIGCELAQAFARLGTRVTVFEAAPHLLPREDPDAAAIVTHALTADGVDVRTATRVTTVEGSAGGVRVTCDSGAVTADRILVATGRLPNVETLGLDAARVARTEAGIRVDDRLRTTNARIYASGDVASPFKFTHAADALSRVVLQNALFFGRRRASALAIPWCTFTDPAVAHVGITSADAAQHGAETVTVPLAEVDRAIVDEAANGFLRIHHRRGRILGATIVAPAAGELIGTIAWAMQKGARLGEFASVAFPYPTLSSALRQAADAYRRTSLTPRVRKLLKYYFRRLG